MCRSSLIHCVVEDLVNLDDQLLAAARASDTDNAVYLHASAAERRVGAAQLYDRLAQQSHDRRTIARRAHRDVVAWFKVESTPRSVSDQRLRQFIV